METVAIVIPMDRCLTLHRPDLNTATTRIGTLTVPAGVPVGFGMYDSGI